MTVDWSELDHAYGPATDTPGHLYALEFGDATERWAALGHLDTAVLHQGFPSSATAPALRAVAALLAEGRAQPDTVEPLPPGPVGSLGCPTSIHLSGLPFRSTECCLACLCNHFR